MVNARRIRHSAASLGLAVVASLVLAATATASPLGWTAPVNMRVHRNVFLDDAAFHKKDVAVAWQERRSGTTRVGFRTSVNSGASFGSAEYVGHSKDAALDVCGGSVLSAAYSHDVGSGHWQIEYAVRDVAGHGFDRELVSASPVNQHDPDIACADGRVFVTWYEPAGSSGDRMYVASAKRSDGVFSTPLDLGLNDETTYGSSLAVAGVPGHAYVVFTRSDGDLMFKHFSVGGGSALPVSADPEIVIGNGRSNNSADYALVAAEGSKVAVAWFKCGGLFVRVSNDHGATWDPAHKITHVNSCESDLAEGWSSVAIDGGRIIAVYVAAGAFGGGFVDLVDTTTDFASYSDDTILSKFNLEHMAGFVKVGTVHKIAAAFNPFNKVRFRREM